ncbi:MAG: ComF family protein [Deltaproteobacteria bacterium]|nr:ComF family protein [Deltaproteobacteria bacterium]
MPIHAGQAGKCHTGSVAVFAAFRYESISAKRLIHALKYSGTEAAADTAACLAGPMFIKTLPSTCIRRPAYINESDVTNIILIPIPLSPSRKKKRGFNQSLLFAEAFSIFLKQAGIRATVLENALRRIRDTKSQTMCKTRNERAKNVIGCFEFIGFPTPYKFRESIIFLVDDVVTSGATIEEAARTLHKAKVPHVAGLCIAKT